MPMNIPCVTLNNEKQMPILGLGTWNSKPGEVTAAVKDAIDCGYRHIDCAHAYLNEAEVGVALKEKIEDGTVKREDLFITSKLWNIYHSKNLVLPAIKVTLKNLGLDYVDLYLIHWPIGFKEGGETFPKDENDQILTSDVDYIETWPVMEECVRLGLTKSIGLSNFNKDQIERILSIASIPPVNNQVECHPYLSQRKLMDYCKTKDIYVTAYSPLGSPDSPFTKPTDQQLMDDPKIVEMAKKYAKSPAQILIRFQIQLGNICIPKSVTKSRIENNFQIFDFELSKDDLNILESMDCKRRGCCLEWLKDHPHYPFKAEF